MIRVYVDMVADLFHVGHLNLIQSARKFGDTLIVGIHSDEDVSSYKRMPIINEKDRYEMVRSCRYVDEVIEEAPLKITKEFLEKNKIDFVVHGDDVSDELKRQHQVPLELGIVKYVPYTKGVSTTEIIGKIRETKL
tara:strand:- start:1329 stop:1736 length:408 start_codon:yes stop_codon:yes gene_type:complete